jgi:hypothetical protein
MSVAIPVTNGQMSAGPLMMQMPSAGTPPPAATQGAPSAADVQGMGQLTGAHNTPMHVAGILLLAGGALAFFKFSGFRFAFDVGLGRG